MKEPSHSPLVRVSRGGHLEGLHYGTVLVCDRQGRVVKSWGDPAGAFFPRSAWKPLQALPFLTTGAADRYGFGDEHIAQVCASHLGEAGHRSRVEKMLGALGLGEGHLCCGPTRAREPEGGVSTLYHNCSGKHSGFLATACHCSEPVGGYTDPGHPVQVRALKIMAEMCGLKPLDFDLAIDGCTAPAPRVGFVPFTRALARLADPHHLPDELRGAAGRIARAMSAHPRVLEGEGGFTTDFTAAAGGRFFGKNGAESVFTAAFPERGLALTVKIADGSYRALGPAVGAVMKSLGLMPDDFSEKMKSWWAQDIVDSRGRVVGRVEANPEVFGPQGQIPKLPQIKSK